jgi:hypothetical protein
LRSMDSLLRRGSAYQILHVVLVTLHVRLTTNLIALFDIAISARSGFQLFFFCCGTSGQADQHQNCSDNATANGLGETN